MSLVWYLICGLGGWKVVVEPTSTIAVPHTPIQEYSSTALYLDEFSFTGFNSTVVVVASTVATKYSTGGPTLAPAIQVESWNEAEAQLMRGRLNSIPSHSGSKQNLNNLAWLSCCPAQTNFLPAIKICFPNKIAEGTKKSKLQTANKLLTMKTLLTWINHHHS